VSSICLPTLETGDRTLDRAWRLALDDLASNIAPHRAGLLEKARPVLLAGLDYDRPWTRDAAINVWNGAGLLAPRVARDTLLSVLTCEGGVLCIGGQYWDAIIWVSGAWAHYLYSGDREFLVLALEATANSLAHFEATEFDAEIGLFRGAACYGDGVAAYPGVYARPGDFSGILQWPERNPEEAARPGCGLPMHALSTNCLYARAYELAGRMAGELGREPDAAWPEKAAALRRAVDRHFWMPEADRYRYLVDPFGGCEHQEGLGHAFAILFGVASEAQAAAVLESQHVARWGIPCVWPVFERYRKTEGAVGRHCGTIWPQVQGFWAEACARTGRADLFAAEMHRLAELAVRSGEFREIYHPDSGEPVGGEQEGRATPWRSCRRQTWSATAYLRMVLMGLLGLRFEPDAVRFEPSVPDGLGRVRLAGLPWRGATLEITIEGSGHHIKTCRVNGELLPSPALPVDASGPQHVEITLS